VIVGLILWLDYIEPNFAAIGISLFIDQPILGWAIIGFMLAVIVGILFTFLSLLLIRVDLKKIESSGDLISTVPVAGPYLLARSASLPASISYAAYAGRGLALHCDFIPSCPAYAPGDQFIPTDPIGLFLALTVTLLMHRLIWTLVNRSIYALQKYDVAKRNTLGLRNGSGFSSVRPRYRIKSSCSLREADLGHSPSSWGNGLLFARFWVKKVLAGVSGV
jgi:ABC-type amino acid transport system permease subunit